MALNDKTAKFARYISDTSKILGNIANGSKLKLLTCILDMVAEESLSEAIKINKGSHLLTTESNSGLYNDNDPGGEVN